MEIIPAIDIINGRVGRLFQGDFARKKEYQQSPLETAKKFVAVGLKNLHLIDLDGAKNSKITNWQVIEDIARNTNFSLQVGGGVRSITDVQKLLALGARRVIIGSLVNESPELFKEILKFASKEKIVADIGWKNNEIFEHGWQEKINKDFYQFLREMIDWGVKFILLTDIEKDGVLSGPNFGLYKQVVRGFPELSIIASGGITTKEDLKKLSDIGVWGAVVGKAIHEQKISLTDLQSLCAIQKNKKKT